MATAVRAEANPKLGAGNFFPRGHKGKGHGPFPLLFKFIIRELDSTWSCQDLNQCPNRKPVPSMGGWHGKKEVPYHATVVAHGLNI